MKKYLPHTTCMKCISLLKYFARPSIKGSSIQAEIFNSTAFIKNYEIKSSMEQIMIIKIAKKFRKRSKARSYVSLSDFEKNFTFFIKKLKKNNHYKNIGCFYEI